MSPEPALARWVRFLWRRERAVRWAWVVFALVAATSLSRLRLEMDLPAMLPDGRPAFDSFRTLVEDFAEIDELVVLVRADDTIGLDAFRASFVEEIERRSTVASVSEMAGAAEVEALLRRYLPHLVPERRFDELRDRLRPEAIEAAVARWPAILAAPGDLDGVRRVRRDPLGLSAWAAGAVFADLAGNTAPSNPRSFVLLVRPVASAFEAGFAERLLGDVRDAEADARRRVGVDGLSVGLTGSYAYAVEDEATIRADLRRYGAMALVGVLAVFALAYRSLRIVPFAAVVLVTVTLATFASSTLLFGSLDAVSLSFAAILYGLAIDSAIHFYTRLQEELASRHPGEGRDPESLGGPPTAEDADGAVLAAWRSLLRPQLVASATTAIAFAVAAASAFSPVRQLGVLTAVGMLWNVAAFFVLYPVLGRSLARRLRPRDVATPRLGRLAGVCGRAGRASWLAGIALIAVLGATGLPLEIDGSLDRLRPGETPARRVEEAVRELTARRGDAAVVLARADDVADALETARGLESLLGEWESRGRVEDVAGPTTLLPPHRLQEERLRRWSTLPFEEIRASYEDALRRHGFSPRSAPPFLGGLDPSPELLLPGAPALDPFRPLLDRHLQRHGDGWLVGVWAALVDSPEALAADLGESIPGARLASRAWLESELVLVLRDDVRRFALAAFVAAGVLLWWSLRSLAVAGAVLLPTAATLAGLVAIFSALGAGIDPVNVVLIALVIGLAIDDGVYLASRWDETGDLAGAFRSGGRAVVVTTLTTVTGFGLLGLSVYPALASLGLLAGVGVSLALLASLTILPALLGTVERRRSSR